MKCMPRLVMDTLYGLMQIEGAAVWKYQQLRTGLILEILLLVTHASQHDRHSKR